MSTKIGDFPCKPLPVATKRAMNEGVRQRYAIATTTKPVSMVKVG